MKVGEGFLSFPQNFVYELRFTLSVSKEHSVMCYGVLNDETTSFTFVIVISVGW